VPGISGGRVIVVSAVVAGTTRGVDREVLVLLNTTRTRAPAPVLSGDGLSAGHLLFHRLPGGSGYELLRARANESGLVLDHALYQGLRMLSVTTDSSP
jgi:hypothetical protein